MGITPVPPDTPARAWPEIPGFIHYEQERYEAFGQWAEAGLARDPESLALHEHRFYYRALHGEWEGAWRDWQSRSSRQRLLQRFSPWPEWTGEPIPGKTLLVIGESGLGDQIMFSRWLGKAFAAGGPRRIVFTVKPPLLNWNFGQGDWLTVAEGEHLSPFDLWIGSESLPLVTGATEPFPVAAARPATATTTRVGICWHGNPDNCFAWKRSTPFDLWLPLLQTPGLSFLSLQYGECPDRRMEALGRIDIADTSRRMENLDLVISADTSIAHLAGAMGLPVWVPLHRPPEWRWGLAGESTVWYPSMRLFRQERRGEWRPVFERIEAELRRVARSSAAGAGACERQESLGL